MSGRDEEGGAGEEHGADGVRVCGTGPRGLVPRFTDPLALRRVGAQPQPGCGGGEEDVGEQADRGPAVPGGPGGDLAAV